MSLEVIEDVPAGTMPSKEVGSGQAIRIMTGAPIPRGADTVLKVEDTEATPASVRVFKAESKGANIRPQGEDVKKGDCIISRGTRLRPSEAGMLAILAKPFVFVYQRPRVAILSTGMSWRTWMNGIVRRRSSTRTATGWLRQYRKPGVFRCCSASLVILRSAQGKDLTWIECRYSRLVWRRLDG